MSWILIEPLGIVIYWLIGTWLLAARRQKAGAGSLRWHAFLIALHLAAIAMVVEAMRLMA